MLYFQGKKVRNYLQWILVPLLLGALLFFSHCNPADRYQYHYPVSQETKDYCYFEEGSWWVYVDSNRMVYDTVICTRSTIERLDDRSVTSYPVEAFSSSFVSSFHGESYLYRSGVISKYDTTIYQSFILLNVPQSYPYYSIFFKATVDSLSYQEMTLLAREQNQDFRGYSSVKGFEVHEIGFGDKLPNTVIWAPHIGIVYKTMPDGSHWELMDYEVLQP